MNIGLLLIAGGSFAVGLTGLVATLKTHPGPSRDRIAGVRFYGIVSLVALVLLVIAL